MANYYDRLESAFDAFYRWEDELERKAEELKQQPDYEEIEYNPEGLDPDTVPEWVQIVDSDDGEWEYCEWLDNLGNTNTFHYCHSRPDITTIPSPAYQARMDCLTDRFGIRHLIDPIE